VIDFGDLCAGDPAYDLAAGWLLLPDDTTEQFYAAYQPTPDTATLRRARGWRWHAPSAASSSATPASTAAPAASPPGAHPPTPPCNAPSPQSADLAIATASDRQREQPSDIGMSVRSSAR